MMKIMLLMIVMITSLISSMSHPLSLGMTLLIQTILICSMTRFMTTSAWISLTIFLVMVGGLMVIFTYVTSICSNKKFSFPSYKFPVMYTSIFSMWWYLSFESSVNVSMVDMVSSKDLINLEFIKLFLSMNVYSSNFMFIYLLLMLVLMINILKMTKGPMRKKY